MAIDERVSSVLHEKIDEVAAHPLVGGAGRWLARGAVTVVLSVAGCALVLAALAALQAAPLLLFALIALASWRASAGIVASIEEAGATPPQGTLPRLRCISSERPGAAIR
jgi:hypothetical protein